MYNIPNMSSYFTFSLISTPQVSLYSSSGLFGIFKILYIILVIFFELFTSLTFNLEHNFSLRLTILSWNDIFFGTFLLRSFSSSFVIDIFLSPIFLEKDRFSK